MVLWLWYDLEIKPVAIALDQKTESRICKTGRRHHTLVLPHKPDQEINFRIVIVHESIIMAATQIQSTWIPAKLRIMVLLLDLLSFIMEKRKKWARFDISTIPHFIPDISYCCHTFPPWSWRRAEHSRCCARFRETFGPHLHNSQPRSCRISTLLCSISLLSGC